MTLISSYRNLLLREPQILFAHVSFPYSNMTSLEELCSTLAGAYETPPSEIDLLSRPEPTGQKRVEFLCKYPYPVPCPAQGILLVDSTAVKILSKHYGSTKILKICYGYGKSVFYVDSWMQDLFKADVQVPVGRPPDYNVAVEQVWSSVKHLKVKSLDFMTELNKVELQPQASNGIGFPVGSRRGDPKCQRLAKACATRLLLDYAASKDKQSFMINNAIPDLGYVRTQVSPVGRSKIRCVHGRSTIIIYIEACSAQPLTEEFIKQKFSHYFAVGLNDDDFIRLMHTMRSDDPQEQEWFYTLMDWSSFDRTCCHFELVQAFSLIRRLLTFPNLASYHAFDFVRQNFFHSKIVTPTRELYQLRDVIISGSEFTVHVDNFVNAIRKTYIQLRITGSPQKMIILQDDSLECTQQEYRFTEIQSVIKKHFACILKPEKIQISKSLKTLDFLSHQVHGLSLSRPEEDIIRAICFPERLGRTKFDTTMMLKLMYEDSGSRYLYLKHAYTELMRTRPTILMKDIDKAIRKYRTEFHKFARR